MEAYILAQRKGVALEYGKRGDFLPGRELRSRCFSENALERGAPYFTD